VITVLAASLRAVWGNPRLVRAAAVWGLWVGGEAGLLVPLSVSAFSRGGTTALAIVGACRFVPAAISTPVASILADRMPRARLMLLVLLSWAALVALIPLCLRGDSLLWLYLDVAATSLVSTPFRPAATALVPQIVNRPEELSAANSAYSILEAAGTLLGPLLAGLVVAATSADTGYLAIAACLVLGAGLTLGITTEFQPAALPGGFGWRRLLEPLAGFPAILGRRKIRAVFGVFLAQTCVRGMFNVLVGSCWRPALPFCVGMSLWGLPLLAIAAWPSPAVAWFAITVIGTGNAVADVYGYSIIHRLIPDHLLGRVWGAFWGSAAATQAIGAVAAAALINSVGIRTALVVTGAAMALIAGAAWLSLRTIDSEFAVDDDVVEVLHRCVLFAPLTRVALEQLARHAEPVDAPAGTTVVEQGASGDTFYVIASGELQALVDGQPARQMAAGDCFGEIAALQRSPRTATVVTLSDCRLLTITGDDFVLAVTGFKPAEYAAKALVDQRLNPRVQD
jgi:MFS family permease